MSPMAPPLGFHALPIALALPSTAFCVLISLCMSPHLLPYPAAAPFLAFPTPSLSPHPTQSTLLHGRSGDEATGQIHVGMSEGDISTASMRSRLSPRVDVIFFMDALYEICTGPNTETLTSFNSFPGTPGIYCLGENERHSLHEFTETFFKRCDRD